MNRRRIAHAALLLSLALAPALLASPALGYPVRDQPSSCTPAAPGVAVDNTWDWSAWGSWGMPGQERMYAVQVMNNDRSCSSSSFVINVSAPGGFSVSIPTNSITLGSSSSAYVWAYVTSPTWAANGDYPLIATVQRAGGGAAASFTSYYKVYSSDSAPPSFSWVSPADGSSISGRSYNVTVSSKDDHQVTKIELYLDNAGAPTYTMRCDGVAATCSLYYRWAIRRVHGRHTATFKSYDWMGNVGVLPVTFNVN
jgi:Bacterial Ig domain